MYEQNNEILVPNFLPASNMCKNELCSGRTYFHEMKKLVAIIQMLQVKFNFGLH
jgi:hypothetical protein